MTTQDFKTLAEHTAKPCISIYLKTHIPGENVQQDMIKLKKLLHEAELRLAHENHRSGQIADLLAPAYQLLMNPRLWQHYPGGVALFIAPNFFQFHHAPGIRDDLLVVTNAFHSKPLLPLLMRDCAFHVLALSQKQIRLYEGTADTFQELELPPGLPRNIDDALLDEDLNNNLQHHTAQPVGQGGIFGMLHGQAPDVYKPQERVFQFYRRIDQGLHDLLRNKQLPLILAGVDENFAIYRRANTYAFLLEEGIRGSADEFRVPNLHKQAWEIVENLKCRNQEKAAALYQELVATGRTSENLNEIVPAAYFGRVDRLFVALNGHRWGAFDPEANRVEIHANPQPGDRDLLDFAATQTFLNGGEVFAVQPGKVPGQHSEIAAVFRY